MSHDNLTNVSPLSISATPYYIIGHSLLYRSVYTLLYIRSRARSLMKKMLPVIKGPLNDSVRILRHNRRHSLLHHGLHSLRRSYRNDHRNHRPT